MRSTHPVHPSSEAERTHVTPDLFDKLKALVLGAFLACFPPAQGAVSVRGPDRILLFVVKHNLIRQCIVVIRCHRLVTPLITASGITRATRSRRSTTLDRN